MTRRWTGRSACSGSAATRTPRSMPWGPPPVSAAGPSRRLRRAGTPCSASAPTAVRRPTAPGTSRRSRCTPKMRCARWWRSSTSSWRDRRPRGPCGILIAQSAAQSPTAKEENSSHVRALLDTQRQRVRAALADSSAEPQVLDELAMFVVAVNQSWRYSAAPSPRTPSRAPWCASPARPWRPPSPALRPSPPSTDTRTARSAPVVSRGMPTAQASAELRCHIGKSGRARGYSGGVPSTARANRVAAAGAACARTHGVPGGVKRAADSRREPGTSRVGPRWRVPGS